MTATGYAESLATEGARLTAIAADAEASAGDLRRPVQSCPGWDLEGLIAHCATVWTFIAGSIVAGGPIDRDSITRPDGPVSRWHQEAFARLTGELETRQPDDPSWTWDPQRPAMSFWWRRITQEATMHRWDAETALGITPAPINPELAVDGINELFDVYVRLRAAPAAFAGNGETVHLHATDAHGEWVITRVPHGMTVERTHAKSDVAARGPAQDLLLFVWGRIGHERLETFGDTGLLEDWQRLVRF